MLLQEDLLTVQVYKIAVWMLVVFRLAGLQTCNVNEMIFMHSEALYCRERLTVYASSL